MSAVRRLAAILAADVAGYSRLMGANEVRTIRDLAERRSIFDRFVAEHDGRIVNSVGDSVLAEFPSATSAVEASIAIQAAVTEINLVRDPDEAMQFRIGLHVGEVILRDSHIFGDGVNVAARLQALAEPGRIVISDLVYDQVRRKIEIAVTDLGAPSLKNIEGSLRVYQIAERANADHFRKPLVDEKQPLPMPDKPSIAVLPFQNMSGDPEQEYFADGIVEDITTALSRFQFLFVIARNSSFIYKGQAIDIKRVGRELGVRYVLEGSIRKAGSRIRITGQLIEAETNAHIWADKFDGDLNDLFDLQDKITTDVVRAIGPVIDKAEIERPRPRAVDRLDSYDLYLRARASVQRGNLSDAYSLAKQAIDLSPNYVRAHALIAFALIARNVDGEVLPPAERDEALWHARTAISLGSADGSSLAMAASIISVLGHEYERAETLIEQALKLNPNSSIAWLSAGWVAINSGAFESALDRFKQVLRFSPFDPNRGTVWYGIAAASSALARYDDGCAAAIKAIQFAPAVHSYGALVINAVPAGRLAEARDAVDKLLKLRPSFRLSHVPPVFHTRDPEWMGRMLAAFAEAGLPE